MPVELCWRCGIRAASHWSHDEGEKLCEVCEPSPKAILARRSERLSTATAPSVARSVQTPTPLNRR